MTRNKMARLSAPYLSALPEPANAEQHPDLSRQVTAAANGTDDRHAYPRVA
jgi:hypothetical protein